MWQAIIATNVGRHVPLAGHHAGRLGMIPAKALAFQRRTADADAPVAFGEQFGVFAPAIPWPTAARPCLAAARRRTASSASFRPSSLPNARANRPRRSESCHRLFRSNGPHLGFGIRLNTALQSAKFLIVRMPTSVIASLTLEISREKPKYDELTNLQHLAGQARIGFDRHGEFGRAVFGILREFEQPNRDFAAAPAVGAVLSNFLRSKVCTAVAVVIKGQPG